MSRLHVIGAGVAGMAAAMQARALGAEVSVYERAPFAGGRARSFPDAELDAEIDNGAHLLLSGNASALRLAERLGARGELTGPQKARFDFFERKSGLRWALELNEGPLPLWLFDDMRRVPDTSLTDYLRALKLPFAGNASVDALFNDGGSLWRRFWEPFSVGVLNTPPQEAAARLLLPVLRETLARGGRFSRPLAARRGLSHLYARPFEQAARRDPGLGLHLSRALKGLAVSGGGVRALKFADGEIPLDEGDSVILALPPWAARRVLPALMAPGRFRCIVNAHFRPPAQRAPREGPFLHGVLEGTAQWVFTRGNIVSVTVSAADRLARRKAEDIARILWPEAAEALEMPPEPLPPFRVIRERRATFAATPAELARRPGPRTGLANLFLAGDWTDTGLPATIEGAARSGERAARVALNRQE